jgi:autotransporter-associated beta strand protein
MTTLFSLFPAMKQRSPISVHCAPNASLAPMAAAMMAAALTFAPAAASAASFTINADSTTAQTLGPDSGQTGTIAAGKALAVSGSKVAVTISGNNAILNNLGAISQTGTGRAIRDNTGVTGLVINNGSAGNSNASITTADADVIQMNVPAASVTLNNYGSLVSLNASAGGAQAVDFSSVTGANTVNNHAGGLITASEADALRPGANGVVTNAGTIRSLTKTGSSSDGVDGQENSGIRVTNAATGKIEGARHGITAGQASSTTVFTLDVSNNAGGLILGNSGSGINVDGFNGLQMVNVVNHGSIVGNSVTADSDGVDVDGLVNITNTGVIRSLNAYSPASSGLAYSEGISAGGGTIVNSGTIEGLVNAGNSNAVGRGITLAGNDITSGALAGTREGLYGNAVITNQTGGLVRGASDSAIVATGAANNYTVTIANSAGATILGGGKANAAIRTGGYNASITNAGTIDGSSSGKAIEMGGANNTLLIVGGSAQIIGTIDGGTGSSRMVIDAGAGKTFSYAGSISNFASVEVKSGEVTLSGQNTYAGATVISGGVLTLAGAGRLSSDSSLVLAGGTLNMLSAGGGEQTFASLSLQDSSTIALGSSRLTFNGLGSVAAGETLVLTDVSGTSGYAFRFLGDYVDNASFRQLMSATTIDSTAVRYSFDGTYTNVLAVPEPASVAMMLGGLGLIGVMARRRAPAQSR